MRHSSMGLGLAAGVAAAAWWLGGARAGMAAAGAGAFAVAIESVTVALLVPALYPPFDRLLKRWVLGLGLRLAGVAIFGVAVLLWPGWFPVLPTAAGFLGVLIPLMFGEMRLVVMRLRTTR